ncbi:MAG TPA: hypothetical protein VMI54_11970 [Polyangiaceae bacterium]|nr:hypothetical protein [Polyangiaceae bacterium]
MSARDTKRDLDAGPHDTLRELPRVAREPDDDAGTDDRAPHDEPPGERAGAVEEDTTGARKKFDPYRFQANTVPPGMRAELLQAEPEEHPSDLMQDTLPPNRPAARSARDTALGGTRDDSGVHRAARRPGLRPLALVSLALTAIALAVLVAVAATRPRVIVRESRAQGVVVPALTATASTVAPANPTQTTAHVPSAAPNLAATAPSVPTAAPEPAVTPAAPRATVPPQKKNAPKSEPPTHGSRLHRGPDLDSPLMP